MTTLTCISCGVEAPAPDSAGTCPVCNDPFAVLDVQYDMACVQANMTSQTLKQRPMNHWRYAELLPVHPDKTAFTWPVGMTPIINAPRLANKLGAGSLMLKDDGRNPTASFKDRASSIAVLHALQQGATHIACASTGNAASSLAGFAAIAGLNATIFIPYRAPKPKVAQLMIYGANVMRVQGTYAQAYDLCTAQCAEHGWYNRNCAINPYLVEGKKTCGLEIAEQTASNPPDWVAVAVGDGCSIAGVCKGLTQMHELGLLEKLPRVLGVQAQGVCPIAQAFETSTLNTKGHTGTLADSIDVPVPRNWKKAVACVAKTQGDFVCVSDDQITTAMKQTATLAGVFAEPAAAAAVAGVGQAVAQGIIDPASSVLAVITGNGLKDIDRVIKITGQPNDINP